MHCDWVMSRAGSRSCTRLPIPAQVMRYGCQQKISQRFRRVAGCQQSSNSCCWLNLNNPIFSASVQEGIITVRPPRGVGIICCLKVVALVVELVDTLS